MACVSPGRDAGLHEPCLAATRNRRPVRNRRRRGVAGGLHGVPAVVGAAIDAQPRPGAGRRLAALGVRAAFAPGGRVRVRLRAGGAAGRGCTRTAAAAGAGRGGRGGDGHGSRPAARGSGARPLPVSRRRGSRCRGAGRGRRDAGRRRCHAAGIAGPPAATGLVSPWRRRLASAAVEARIALATSAAGPRAARPAQSRHQRCRDARLRRPHRGDRLRARRRWPAPARAGTRHRCMARPDVHADRRQHPVADLALRARAGARRHARPRRSRLDRPARGRAHAPHRDLRLACRAGGERHRLAGVGELVAVADARPLAAAHARGGNRRRRRRPGLRRRRRVRVADDAHRADDLAGGAGAPAAPRTTCRRHARAGLDRDPRGRSAVGAGAGFLAQLRRGRLAPVVPSGQRRTRLARAPGRVLRRAGGRDGRIVAAHGGVVRAGVAGGAGREHRRHSLVEPGGRPAGTGGHGTGGIACGVGRMAVAPGGICLRSAMAGLRMDRAQPAGALVPAGTGVVRGAARVRGCRLGLAAAWRPRQAAGLAAVVAAVVAATRAAVTRRRGRDGNRRRAGAFRADPDALACLAVRHGSRQPRRLRCRRRCRGAGAAGAGRARPRCDRAQPRRQRPRRRLSLGRDGLPAAPAVVPRGHAGESLRVARGEQGASARGLPRGGCLALGRRGVPIPASAALVPLSRQRLELRVARSHRHGQHVAAARRHQRRGRTHAGAARARRIARVGRGRGAPRQPRFVGPGIRRGRGRVLVAGVRRRPQPFRPSRSGRGRALAPSRRTGRSHGRHRRADPAPVRQRHRVRGRTPPARAPVGAKPVSCGREHAEGGTCWNW